MSNSKLQTKSYNFCTSTIGIILIFFTLWSLTKHQTSNISTLFNLDLNKNPQESEAPTFYDDPETHYTIDKPMKNWDEKRRQWIHHHPSFASEMENRMLVLSGSQASPCKHPTGDHFLLRFFKNKIDYCRINGYQIFYNNAYLEPKMRSCWAKIPLVRAAMVAHPESEWILWIDVDAIFTDMSFKIPLEKYRDYNFVVHGWPEAIDEKKSWLGLNAGVFLIRNCQWSMDFLDVWASMGPTSPDYEKWGRIMMSTFSDRKYPISDDQTALVYLLLKEKEKWGDKIYVQNEYSMNSYWLAVVGKFENITKNHVELEKEARKMRRRHAEAVDKGYPAEEEEVRRRGGSQRPFITHFAGCQPCSGDHNPAFDKNSCWVEMERALNFADNQVLRNYGFVHKDLGDGSSVTPVPFDYPRAQI